MAEKKSKGNIFKRIWQRFIEVRQEMKRVIWPTREKLLQTAVVVLAVIVASAIVLSLIGEGNRYLLGKVGFYNQAQASVTTTATSETTAATSAPTSDTTTTTTVTADTTTGSTAA